MTFTDRSRRAALFGDEQLKVEIIADTAKFQAGTVAASKTLEDFSGQGTKAITRIHTAQKTWTADLVRGQARGQIRLIAMEMGNLAGAGGVAGRAVGSLMAVMGTGGLVGVLAIAATAFGFLIRRQKEAAEEARKNDEATRLLADAYRDATEAKTKLNVAQEAAGRAAVFKQAQADEIKYSGLVKEDEKSIKALTESMALHQQQLREVSRRMGENSEGAIFYRKTIQNEGIELDGLNGLLDAHKDKQADAAAAIRKATEEHKKQTEAQKAAQRALDALNEKIGRQIEDETERIAKAEKAKADAVRATSDEIIRSQKAAEQAYMSATSGMQSAMTGFLTSAITGTQSLQDAWKSFTTSFINSAVEMFANVAVKALFKIIGTAILGPGFGAVTSVLPLAEGNARVTRPTLAVIGEGPEPENVLTDSQLASATGGIHIGSMSLSYSGPGTENDKRRFVGSAVQEILKTLASAQARTGRLAYRAH